MDYIANVATLILVILYIVYDVGLKPFVVKKAENLATKQDIENITTLVEKVKNDFQFQTKSKLSLSRQERDSLIQFYLAYSKWLNFVIFRVGNSLYQYNKEEISKTIKKLSIVKFNFEIALAEKSILVKNEEIDKIQNELIELTDELSKMYQSIAIEFHSDLLYFEKRSCKNSDAQNITLRSELNELRKLKRTKMYEDIKPILKKLVELKPSLKENIKTHIEQIITR